MADINRFRETPTAIRERKIWELRAQGWSQFDIAAKLDISQPTVSVALKRANKKFHDSFVEDIMAFKQEQFHIIMTAAKKTLQQYYKSMEPKKVITKSGKTNKDGQFLGKPVTTIQHIPQTGDAKLLLVFFKALEEANKIWDCGIAKGKGANIDEMTVEEKVNLFNSIPTEEKLKLLDSMLTQPPRIEHSDEKPDGE